MNERNWHDDTHPTDHFEVQRRRISDTGFHWRHRPKNSGTYWREGSGRGVKSVNHDPFETHLNNLSEGEKLELAKRLLNEVDSPLLHVEKMEIGNEACRSADAMERELSRV